MATYSGSDKRLAYLFQNGGGGGGASALNDLSDVAISTPTDGQALLYDAQNQKWINGTVQGGGGSGITTVEEVLESTETTLTAWVNPLSIPLTLSNYVGFGVEITGQSGSSPIPYYVTAGQISGNSYVIIPKYQGGNIGNKSHYDLYIGYSNGNLNFYVETNYSVTIHRVTGLRKKDAYSHTYSTTEQVVGTWIDGKPIYEITKEFLYDSSWCGNRNAIAHGIADIAIPIDFVGRWYSTGYTSLMKEQIRTDSDAYTSNNTYLQASTMVEFRAFSQTDFSVIIGGAFASYPFESLVVTFRYTKSTD